MTNSQNAGDLTFNGRKYVTSRQAAKLSGYTPDYIRQLSRQGDLKSELIAGKRFVELESLHKRVKSFLSLSNESHPGRPRSSVPEINIDEKKKNDENQHVVYKSDKVDKSRKLSIVAPILENKVGYFETLARASKTSSKKDKYKFVFKFNTSYARWAGVPMLISVAFFMYNFAAGDIKRAVDIISYMASESGVDIMITTENILQQASFKLVSSVKTGSGYVAQVLSSTNISENVTSFETPFVSSSIAYRDYSLFDTQNSFFQYITDIFDQVLLGSTVAAIHTSNLFKMSKRPTLSIDKESKFYFDDGEFSYYKFLFAKSFSRDTSLILSLWYSYSEFLDDGFQNINDGFSIASKYSSKTYQSTSQKVAIVVEKFVIAADSRDRRRLGEDTYWNQFLKLKNNLVASAYHFDINKSAVHYIAVLDLSEDISKVGDYILNYGNSFGNSVIYTLESIGQYTKTPASVLSSLVFNLSINTNKLIFSAQNIACKYVHLLFGCNQRDIVVVEKNTRD